MSELTNKLQRMLAQAQGFAKDAPLEALTRARLAAQQAQAALAGGVDGAEREQLEGLAALAASRIEKYEAVLAAWGESVRERADLFVQNERDRLAQAIPAKV